MHTTVKALFLFFLVTAIPICSTAQLAADKCKFLGNVIPSTTPADYKTYWNQVTPENAGKWGSVEAKRDQMTWTALDNAYTFARSNNLPFKQHTLVWGQQQPAWITTLTPEEQKAEVEEWIKLFCERYPDTDFIDVVNEPLHAIPAYAAALGGNGSTGWDWVVWAFEKAREYCPNAKLILNEYNVLSTNAKANTYVQIINLLKSRELIDGVGEQGHFLETTPKETIETNLSKLAATGLPIHISEYDVNLKDDNAQRKKYEEQFPIFWSHPAVHGVTLWGYRQGHVWREDSYLIRANGSERPALTWLKAYVKDASGGTLCDPVMGMLDEQHDMEIYPSPVRDGQFTLDVGLGNFQIRIRDMHGQIKHDVTVNSNGPLIVSLAEPAGLYLVEVYDGQQTTCKKILIN